MGVHYKHDRNHRRKTQDSLIKESIRLDLAIGKGSNKVLIFLAISVKRRHVEVGRCVIDGAVCAISVEYIYSRFLMALVVTFPSAGEASMDILTMGNDSSVTKEQA